MPNTEKLSIAFVFITFFQERVIYICILDVFGAWISSLAIIGTVGSDLFQQRLFRAFRGYV